MSSAKRDENREVALILQNTLGTGVIFPTGASLTNATPAHVALVDGNGDQIVPVSNQTSSIYNGVLALIPLFAPINASGNGDNTIIAAVANKQIRVLNGLLIASAPVNIYFRDDTAGTAITGTLDLAVNGGFQIPYSPIGNFQTSSGNSLVLNLSGAIPVGGWISYITL